MAVVYGCTGRLTARNGGFRPRRADEHPFRYVYHTLRWLSDAEDKEDIGVEVMVTAEDAAAGFRLPLPLLDMDGSAPLAVGGPIHCGRGSRWQ